MPLSTIHLRLGDRGSDVASLHRSLASLNRTVDSDERQKRLFGPATEALLRELQTQSGLRPTGEFDEPTRGRIETMLHDTVPFTVFGRLTDPDRRPIAGATILALDMDVGRSETLGQDTTDVDGEYEIRYSAEKFTRSDKVGRGAALVVHALFADELLAESRTLFRAPSEVRIDLRAEKVPGPPEFERLLAALGDRLGDRPLAELTAKDVALIAGDTGQDGARIEMLAQAHRLAQQGELSAEAIFGWLAQGLPADLDALSRQPQEALAASLARAAEADTVSAATSEGGAAHADAVVGVRRRRLIESATSADVKLRDPWLGQIRESLGAGRFERFATVFSGYGDEDTLAAKLADNGFEPDEIAQARRVLTLKAISKDHAPLLEALATTPDLGDPQTLVTLDVADWRTLLTKRTAAGAPIGTPDNVPGRTADARLGNYARLLAAEVEARLPTERFGERAKRDLENPDRVVSAERRQDWVRFLAANPDFDLRTTNLRALLDEPDARDRRLAGVADPETLEKDLAAVQRVFRLVPPPLTLTDQRSGAPPFTDRYDPVITLIEAGFDSATAVLRVPPRIFEIQVGSLLGTVEVAKRVYMRAAYVGDAALLAMLKARALVDDASPAFASVADYPTLFGPSHLCECEHCRSFFGPAAYFVDTLQFLREATASRLGHDDEPDALWKLLDARRPDLKRIALSCANTNTELPYLDLVNEVLEEAVAPPSFFPFRMVATAGFNPIADLDARAVSPGIRAAFRQSANAIALSAATLIHLNLVVRTEGAIGGEEWFITDRGTLYALFSRGTSVEVRWASRQTSGTTEELIAAPEHFNESAYRLLAESIVPWSLPFDLGWEELRGLLEQSGLSLHHLAAAFEAVGDAPLDPLAATESAAVVRELLGMSEPEFDIVGGTRVEPPEAYWNVPVGSPTWHLTLAPVDVLLERTGVSYVELLHLLDARFVNPADGVGRTLSIVSIDPKAPATCDVTMLVVEGLDPVALDRLHRFVRLWRRLGWTIPGLDVVLRALGASDLTPTVLTEVSHVERLRRTLKLPLDQIAALFAPIDTVRYLNVSEEGARWVPSLYDRVFQVTAGRARTDAAFAEDPRLLTGTVDDHAPAIRAALAIDEASFTLLSGDKGVLKEHNLNLASLSSLFRYTVLARSLALTPTDLLRVTRLVGGFSESPSSVSQFIAAATRVAATGLVLDDLEFFLTSDPDVDARLGRSVADVQRVLGELSRRMLEVDNAEQRRERLIQGLATASGLSPAVIATIDRAWISLLQHLAIPPPAQQPVPGGDVLLRLGKLARLLQVAALPDAEAAWLCRRAADLGLPDLLALPVSAQDARVPFTAFEGLLDFLEVRRAARNPLAPLYLVIELAFGPGGSLTAFARALAAATGWSEADIRWCLTAPAGPVIVRDDVPKAARRPATYARMMRALGFARRLGAPATTVAAIVGRADRPAAQPHPGPGPDPDPVIVRPVRRWTTARRAEELTRLLRARHDPAAWLTIVKPPNDCLRERRRDALVAYLLHVHPNGLPARVRSTEDLFAYFLVDVEMGACMPTSRIKHAISTAQTFIQRCLMQLEGDAARLDPVKAREWTEWRGIYRIWEANRKVFLYPENWLEPGLRETRTPFFKELESDLNNGELTPEGAEEIVRGYLTRFEAVSNLEPVAIHREITSTGREVMHVLARTPSLPHVHYYRRRTKVVSSNPGVWSPWERLDVDLDSEHVILLVFQGRLRLYWAVIREVPNATPPPDPANKTGTSRSEELGYDPWEWGITLFWSEYDDGRWSRRQELKVQPSMTVRRLEGMLPAQAVTFRARVAGNTVELDCHLPHHGYMKSLAGSITTDSVGRASSQTPPPTNRSLVQLPGASPFGMGYRTSTGLRFLPDACLKANDAEADVYAVDGQQMFTLLDNTAGAERTTILSPTLAAGLNTKISTEGIISLFNAGFPPVQLVVGAITIDLSFERSGPEQAYYWEIFFHVPLLIATRFLRNRRFEDARRWLHCIFDPTLSAGSGAERFWITPPFRALLKSSPEAVRALLPSDFHVLAEQVAAMRSEPFRPHAIAALRIAAYMRTTFFRYMDVLIEWGDHLFRRETIESLNEATQLYVMARAMLGARPESVPARALPVPQTFESLIANPDFDSDLANAEVEIGEVVIPDLTTLPPPTPSLGTVAMFCFPRNDRIGRYQTTVEDRLYKVRHCKTIEGGALLLSLWDAPFDPALLVRATAAGLDLRQILDELTSAGSPFRFNVLIQKANELCAEVRSFGAALLAALEKRDGERLGRLRAHHEVDLVSRVRDVKQGQLKEAQLSTAALKKSLAVCEARGDHYARLLRTGRQALPAVGDEGGLEALASTVGAPPMMPTEGTVMLMQEYLDFVALDGAQRAQKLAASWELAAAFAHPFTASIGASVSGGVGFVSGGTSTTMTFDIGAGLSAIASQCRADATQRNADSTRLSKQAALMLRAYDWALQIKLAVRERAQIGAQILAAAMRETIAADEVANHNRQIEEAGEVERFLREKYTGEELYDWTIGELTKLYFASYRLAQSMARRAEAAYRREIGTATAAAIVGGDHWDGYYNGLLAGERLSQDIKRLEVAYLDDSARRYELTKHVSLAQSAPEKLLQLRESGSCVVTLIEGLFDADYPDHELRRIKTVAVTIPAVTGPYAGVHCTLTLGATGVRRDGVIEATGEKWGTDTIATSHGVNDSGLFEQNLRDERFLPFEGAGAINSVWSIELSKDQNAFDLKTVADVVLHLRYTAKVGTMRAVLSTPRSCLFDLRREFPDAWHRWKTGAATAPLLATIDGDRLPFTHGTISSAMSFKVYARLDPDASDTDVFVKLAGGSSVDLANDGDYGLLWYSASALASGTTVTLPDTGALSIDVLNGDESSLRESVQDLYLVCQYTIT